MSGKEVARGRLGALGRWAERLRAATRLHPTAVVDDGGDAYVITAQLGSVRREDVSLELDGRVFTIWGKRRRGAFAKSFTLPANADPSRIAATFDGGVLVVSIPKTPRAKPGVEEAEAP